MSPRGEVEQEIAHVLFTGLKEPSDMEEHDNSMANTYNASGEAVWSS